MDVFPSIDSTNNLFEKLIEAYNNVEDNIKSITFEIADQIRRLPVSQDWQFNYEDLIKLFVVSVPITALLTFSVLGMYWMVCKYLQELMINRMKKHNDYKKLEEQVDIEQETSEKKKPRLSTTRARKLILFFSLDMWMYLLLVILFTLHFNRYEEVGAKWNSVQFLVGDRSLTTHEIMEFMVTQTEELNADSDTAHEIFVEVIGKLSLEEMQYISPKLDELSSKVLEIIESTGILIHLSLEAQVKQLSIILSFLFFFTYIIVTHFGLTQMSNLFTNKVVMFTVTMLGNILMFIWTMFFYTQYLVNFLERIHPDPLLV